MAKSLTTDELLAECRTLAEKVIRSTPSGTPAHELATRFGELDAEMTDGAETPEEWCDAEDENGDAEEAEDENEGDDETDDEDDEE